MSDENKTATTEPEKPKPRDKWERAQIIGQLLLPIVIAFAGIIIARQDKINQEENLQADRVTTMLEHLGSEQKIERDLARKVVVHLANSGKIPPEIVPALVETNAEQVEKKTDDEIQSSTDSLATVATQSENSETKVEAKGSLVNLTTTTNRRVALASTTSLNKIDATSANALPARVYLQVQKDASRELATILQARLKDASLLAPGVEGVNQVPDKTEIRYFKGGSNTDADLAAITNVLTALGIKDAKLVDLSARYPNSPARPRHYEIWLGNNTNHQ